MRTELLRLETTSAVAADPCSQLPRYVEYPKGLTSTGT